MISFNIDKRVRPDWEPLLTSKKLKADFDYPDVHSILSNFEKLQEAYNKEGVSQENMLILRRIAANPNVPLDYKNRPLLRFLTQVSKELMLNKLELVMWAMYLDKIVWSDNSLSLRNLLFFSAYAAKLYLNSDISNLNHYLALKFTDFLEAAKKWIDQHDSALFNINTFDLNARFNELCMPPNERDFNLLDYNFYVDEIIQAELLFNEVEDTPQQTPQEPTEEELSDPPPPLLSSVESCFDPKYEISLPSLSKEHSNIFKNEKFGGYGCHPPTEAAFLSELHSLDPPLPTFSRGYSNFSSVDGSKAYESEMLYYVSETADESNSVSISDSEDVNSSAEECTVKYEDFIL